MKINTDFVFENLKGASIKNQMDPKKDLTLSDVCVQSLLASEDGDRDGKTKLARYDLVLKIKDGGEVSLESSDITLIKDLVGKYFSVLVVGQAYKVLEGESVKKGV